MTMNAKKKTSRVMTAGEFKARCLRVMDQVAATGEAVVITKRGAPVVRVMPVRRRPAKFFGALRGTLAIVGDVVSPTGEK
ncbi:MAG TPA: type II toxin-antitoxin system prevent-host-death family antitoxin [Myxococcaceae bacterium]